MIRLIFDCLRAPYDLANILQVALATGKCEIHITGNSLHHDHPKVLGKVGSWSRRVRENGLPNLAIQYWPTLEHCVRALKSRGIRLIGTSPHAEKSFYAIDLNANDCAIVFGTESSGLSREKAGLLDEMVNIPMSSDLDFMTLSVVVPIVVYEAIRQEG
jgi:tRNA G18 (ribose-2'-O)-methylase SpoU